MGLLKTRRLGKTYGRGDSRVVALDSADLFFPSTGFIGIEGKSGSGKSTLLNLLARLEKPTKGLIGFKGRNLNSINPAERLGFRQKEVGLVFQHYNLLEGKSLLDNIAFPLVLAGSNVEEAREKARNLARGILDESLLGKRPNQCSGGEKQRAAILRALIGSPAAILADEPTGALDEENAIKVMVLLKRLSTKRLVVVVSHNHELLGRYADRVIYINDGTCQERTKKTTPKPISVGRNSFWWIKEGTKESQRSWRRLLSCFFACLIGFTSLLCSVSFFLGHEPCLYNERIRSLDAGVATVSYEKLVSTDDSLLSLVVQERPSLDLVMDALSSLSSYSIENDYSFLLPESVEFLLSGQKGEAEFVPVASLSSDYAKELLNEGNLGKDDLSSCLVNQAFIEKYGAASIGRSLIVEEGGTFDGPGWQKDVEVKLSLLVAGVVEEFAFLNSPRIYYSYPALSNWASNFIVFSDDQTSLSLKNLCDSATSDSFYSNYKYRIFVSDKKDLQPFFEILHSFSTEDAPLTFTSRAYLSYASFSSLSQALSACLVVFLALEFVFVGLVIVLSVLSIFTSSRKQMAIMMALGAKKSSVINCFTLPSFLSIGLSACLSIPLAFMATAALNFLLKDLFGLRRLLRLGQNGIDMGLFLGLIGLLLLFFLISFLAMSAAFRHLSLTKEMRDE